LNYGQKRTLGAPSPQPYPSENCPTPSLTASPELSNGGETVKIGG